MTGQRAAIVACLFALSVAGVGVACGTATPVLYGVGEATPTVTGTGVLSSLVAALSGGAGIWTLVKAVFPKAAPIIDIARPIISDTRTIEGGADIVSSLLGGHLDPVEIGEITALLFVQLERVKANDKEGADKAYELIQHIKELESQKGNNAKK